MSDPLQEFIAYVDRRITLIFDTVGVIYPMWHVVTKSGEHRVLTPPATSKDAAAILMRAYFDLYDVVRYVFVDEAWQLQTTITDEAEMREITRRGVASHPDRVEILMYQAEDESGSMTAHRVITRPPRGKAQLGPIEFLRSMQSEGRLVGMLPVRGTAQ